MTKLVFLLGEGREVEFDLSAAVVTLGRARDNDIVIQNSWISSHHARFERVGDTVGLIDLQSHNGILLNGQRVTVAALRSGDVLTFGQLEAVFREVAPASKSPPPAQPAATATGAATVPLASTSRSAEPLTRRQAESGVERRPPPATTPPAASVPRLPEPSAARGAPVRPVTLVPPPYATPVPDPTPAAAQPTPASDAPPPGVPGPTTTGLRTTDHGPHTPPPGVPGPTPTESRLPGPAAGTPPEATAAATHPAINGTWDEVHHFAKALIKRLDLLDALLANVAERDAATAAQLRPLQTSLLELLREYSVEAYTVEVGKALDVATRKKIHIVEPAKDPEGATEIAEVFRPGYVCHNGPGGTATVLRKAEVRTGRSGPNR